MTEAEGVMESPVQRFYQGKQVLITGATGFIGKVLVEKLLRATDVNIIYLLVRPKLGKNAHERTALYFQDLVFSRLKTEAVGFEGRVRVVEGDVSLPGLGLRAEDAVLLRTEVDIILHGAATVRFDEALDRAVRTNVRGTKEVVQLARNCINLKAFVYVSTAYANCPRQEIYEEFFEPPLGCDNAILLTECLTTHQAADISHAICGKYPNTYAFTKAIAEDVIRVYGNGLPVVVFRPSIMVSTAEESFKRRNIDNVYGATGVQCGVGAGVLRAFQINVDYEALIQFLKDLMNLMCV